MSNAIRWTQEQLDEFERRRHPGRRSTDPAAPAAPSKHLNVKTTVDGITYDSSKEAKRAAQLEMMQDAGIITELARQVRFELAPGVRLAGERRKKPALRYYADFTYMRDGCQVIEDTKSDHTRKLEAYRIKKHLMKSVLNLDITEV
jgi:hypothetical protein